MKDQKYKTSGPPRPGGPHVFYFFWALCSAACTALFFLLTWTLLSQVSAQVFRADSSPWLCIIFLLLAASMVPLLGAALFFLLFFLFSRVRGAYQKHYRAFTLLRSPGREPRTGGIGSAGFTLFYGARLPPCFGGVLPGFPPPPDYPGAMALFRLKEQIAANRGDPSPGGGASQSRPPFTLIKGRGPGPAHSDPSSLRPRNSPDQPKTPPRLRLWKQ